jgi:S-formylglutathione hydrolase FrmB
MQVLTVRPATASTRCAVVFLEGRFDHPQSFARAGFDAALAAAGVDAEIVAPDSHLGYFLQDTIVQRLAADVIGPLRARAGSPVWLVGVSMGGTGALAYAQRHPDEVAGVLALAPYLGEPELVSELTAAGGLALWRPSPDMAPDDHIRHLWIGLQQRTAPGGSGPPIYLGYGTQDSFAPSARVLAAALPPERVFTVAGGHRWSAWRRLWDAFLATGALRDSCR